MAQDIQFFHLPTTSDFRRPSIALPRPAESFDIGKPLRSLRYHLYTLWLFNRSDLKTVVAPQTIFGIFGALSGLLVDGSSPSAINVLCKLPQVLLWLWTCLLAQSIANQRLPESIVEDKANKPWRPLPSERLTPSQARRLLLLFTLPVALFLGYSLGAAKETTGFLVFVWIYNELGGSDEGFIVRNVVNGIGLSWLSVGATIVASGTPNINDRAYQWTFLMALSICITVQAQDLPDMIGDAAKGRNTLPLVYGETLTRWSVAINVLACSLACPAFWNMGLDGYILAIGIGGQISSRVLLHRDLENDKISWKLWCVWMMCLYALPWVKSLSM